jgi:hypothetical protein
MVPDIRNSIALFEGSLASLACDFGHSGLKIQISMDHWWIDIDRG